MSALDQDALVLRLFSLSESQDLASTIDSLYASVANWTNLYPWNLDKFQLHQSAFDQVPCLYASLRHGDSVQDEWFIAFLLFQITMFFPNLVATIEDQDGQFLLIEAAEVIPNWLSPELSANRIFILSGSLHIIPLDQIKQPTMSAALALLSKHQGQYKADDSVQRTIKDKFVSFYNCDYSEHVHKALVTLPARLAYCFDKDPELVGHLVNQFYHRVPTSLNTFAFSFESDHLDCSHVTILHKFTRIQYAKLACQQYSPSKQYMAKAEKAEKSTHFSIELGAKLTLGFEIFLRNSDANLASESMLRDRLTSTHLQIPLDNQICARLVASLDAKDDSLDWMMISDPEPDICTEEFMQEAAGDDLDQICREPCNLKQVKQFSCSLDKVQKFLFKDSSEFDGVVLEPNQDGEKIVYEEDDTEGDSDDLSSEDTENDEFIEQEILEAISFDPDLLMKIVEMNAMHGLDSSSLLKRVKEISQSKSANPNQSQSPLGKTRQKGLSDIDPTKLTEARQPSRIHKADRMVDKCLSNIDSKDLDKACTDSEDDIDAFEFEETRTFSQCRDQSASMEYADHSDDETDGLVQRIMDQMNVELALKLGNADFDTTKANSRAKLGSELTDSDANFNLAINMLNACNLSSDSKAKGAVVAEDGPAMTLIAGLSAFK